MATKDEIITAIQDAGGDASADAKKADLLDELRRVAPTHNFLGEGEDAQVIPDDPAAPVSTARGIPDKNVTVALGSVTHNDASYGEGDTLTLPGPTALSLEAQGIVTIEGDA
jgi:hypothetical protein